MSIIGGLSSLSRSLTANAYAIEMVAQNLANASTTAYKRSEVRFKESVIEGIGHSNPAGTSRQTTSFYNLGIVPYNKQFLSEQGPVTETINKFDFAISGQGFFVTRPTLTSTQNSAVENSFTRAGNFAESVENGTESYLKSQNGEYVLGYPYNTTTDSYTISSDISQLQPIRTDRAYVQPPVAVTTSVQMAKNFNAADPIGTTTNADFSIYDGVYVAGHNGERVMSFAFTKTAIDTWQGTLTAANGTVTSPTSPLTITFDESGNLTSAKTYTVQTNFTNPDATNSFSLDISKFTGYDGNDSAGLSVEKDGAPVGELIQIYGADGGIVQARFTNGLIRPIAKLAVADFISPDNLTRKGDTSYEISTDADVFQLLDPENTNLTDVLSYSREGSNTALPQEFTTLIESQRAFNSVSSALRANDEMITTAIGVK